MKRAAPLLLLAMLAGCNASSFSGGGVSGFGPEGGADATLDGSSADATGSDSATNDATAAASDAGTPDAEQDAPDPCTTCSGACVNLQTDDTNCGACGLRCPTGTECLLGVCNLSCGGGETLCNSTCVNLKADNANCGTCGTICTPETACTDGGCVLTCFSGQILCNGQCIDPKSNDTHCGASASCDADSGTAGSVCVAPARCDGGTCQ
jgi:hypothetical protein